MSLERHCDSVATNDGPCPIGIIIGGGNIGIGNEAVLFVNSAPQGSPAESGDDCGLYCGPAATDDGPCPIGVKIAGGIGDGSRSFLLRTCTPNHLLLRLATTAVCTESVMHGVEAGTTGIVGGAVLLVTSALHGYNISSGEAGRDYGLFT